VAKLGRFGKADDSSEEITPAPPRVFVSYRRDDSSGYAGRLYADLSQQLGEDNVFIDIDSLVPGADFIDAIEDTLAACDLVLVVIGRSWLTMTDAHGRRRLDNDNDFVCMEVGEALERSIGVIPVLVGGAVMPDPEELPEKLARLARRHAMDLSDRRWPADVHELLLAIHKAKDQGALRQRDVDRIVKGSTTAREVSPSPPKEDVPKAQTVATGTKGALPDAESSERKPEEPVTEPPVQHAPPPEMASSTIADSRPPKEHTHKSTQPKQQRRWPKWILAARHHPWRVLGVAVLVAAGIFSVHAVIGTKSAPLTVSTVEAYCVSSDEGMYATGGITFDLGGHSLNTACGMVANCYVKHLTGFSAVQWMTAVKEGLGGAPNSINSADNECQKLLPSIHDLVDNTNPGGQTNPGG
jgi:hypothetical protein